MYIKFLPALLLGIIFSGCQDPLNRTYHAQTFEEDMQEIRHSKIDDDDLELLAQTIFVSKLAGTDLKGKTYRDILEKVKSIRKAGKDLAEHDKLLQEARSKRLKPFLAVNLLDKSFIRINEHDYLVYKLSFKNLSASNIRTVTGNIEVNDLLDKPIKKINILLDEKLAAHSSLQKNYQVEYSYENEQDKRIRTKDLSGMRISWNPEKIIFENGHMEQ